MVAVVNLAHTAIGYAEKGFSVIPIAPAVRGDPESGKKPIAKWKEFQTRRATVDEIQNWFASRISNIGIVTGAVSQLVVVDCDDQEAVEYVLEYMEPTGVIAQTGSGGRHFFYRHPGIEVGNRSKIGGMNLDLRGDGGYVVAAPSRHWSNDRYCWMREDWNRLAEFDPSWIADRPSMTPAVDVDQATELIVRRARLYVDRIFSVSGQGGDMQLFRAACSLVQKFQLPEHIALDLLRQWNRTNAEPPWADARLIYKIKEAVRLKG